LSGIACRPRPRLSASPPRAEAVAPQPREAKSMVCCPPAGPGSGGRWCSGRAKSGLISTEEHRTCSMCFAESVTQSTYILQLTSELTFTIPRTAVGRTNCRLTTISNWMLSPLPTVRQIRA
jgi:hypothetical protein